MKILSLFDGMACGMIAMQLAEVEVESYDAYEIDKYAIKTAQHNFPMIKEHGDVFDADFTQYEGVDFLIGGSPCTYWSIAQTKNRETVASGMGWELFSQYVRALHEAKPKYFIYENNKSMSKAIRASIDETFGFEAVLINSALVSAQNRQRLYWVGKRNEDGTYSKVNVEQPEDRGILLKDVLDNAVAWREKAYTIDANYYKATDGTDPFGGHQSNNRMMAADPVCLRYERTEEAKRCRKAYESHEVYHGYNELNELHPRPDGKTNTLTTVLKDNQIMEPVCVAERGRMYCGQPQHYCANGGGAGAKTGLYAMHLDGFIPGERTVGSQMEFLGGINGRHEKWLEDGKNYSRNFSQGHRLYGVNGKSVTQTAQACGYAGNTGLYAIPTMPVKEATAKGYTEIECGDCVDLSMPNSKTRRGRNMKDKSNCMQTSNEFYQYVGYAIEFDNEGKLIKAIGKAGKEITIYEVKDGKITIKGKQYPIKLRDGYYIIRKLTVSECKRLQTVPEWYDFPVSNSQAYKMLGNGWTCEVIAHLIRSCNGRTNGVME